MTPHPVRDALWNWLGANWAWLLTFLLALYAAGLSTFREVQTRRKERERLVIKLSTALVPDGGSIVDYVQVAVEHHGGPSVMFAETCCFLQVKDFPSKIVMWQLKMSDVKTWPWELKSGAAFFVMSPKWQLVQALRQQNLSGVVQLRGAMESQIGKRYESDWQALDLNWKP